MNITITNDAGSTVYEHSLGNNFVILKGKVHEVKQGKYDTRVTLMVGNGKDRDGNWRPSTFCDLSAKEWTAVKGDVVTVRCQYEIRDWTKQDGTKAKFHQFRVWEVLDGASPKAKPYEFEEPFDL